MQGHMYICVLHLPVRRFELEQRALAGGAAAVGEVRQPVPHVAVLRQRADARKRRLKRKRHQDTLRQRAVKG